MGSLLFLYFLHPFKSRLTNKTQRFNPRYELTNPTKTPPSPFAFSLLSVILRHLHYTLQSPSPSVTTPRSFVTLSPHLLLLPPVLMLPCPLQLCYYSSVSLLLCLPLPCLLIPCRVKNVYLSYPQGPLLCPRQGLSSMQNMPFLPLEDALLACRTCPSWRHVFKSLIVRRLR